MFPRIGSKPIEPIELSDLCLRTPAFPQERRRVNLLLGAGADIV
jgi:hypothetical protein